MSATHTPAPWRVEQAPSDPRIAYVTTTDARPIADVWNVPGTHGEQALADARLIAQAPALLDIAQRVEAMLTRQRWLPDGDDPESVLLRDARAAIARAGGRS